MWSHALIVGLWGGLMALERRAFLQAMLSRPLVASTTTGLLLGDVAAGVYLGLLFELMHLGGASLGGAHADHDTLPAVASAAFAAELGNAAGFHSTPAMWTVATLFFLPAGLTGRWVEGRLDARARKYFFRAVRASDEGNFRHAARQNLRAMWPVFVFYGFLCAVAVVLAWELMEVGRTLPPKVVRGLGWAYPLMGVGAAAVAVQASHAKGRFLVAGAAAGVVAAFALAGWYGGWA